MSYSQTHSLSSNVFPHVPKNANSSSLHVDVTRALTMVKCAKNLFASITVNC